MIPRRWPPTTARSSTPLPADVSQYDQPTRYGRIRVPVDAWLARGPAEPILEPELPVIDTHHHLWDRPEHRYLLHELLADLTALGLSLDAWVFHPQLADAVDLARAAPDANIIAGHVGGPLGYGPYAGKRDEVFATWETGITELARCSKAALFSGTARRAYRLD